MVVEQEMVRQYIHNMVAVVVVLVVPVLLEMLNQHQIKVVMVV